MSPASLSRSHRHRAMNSMQGVTAIKSETHSIMTLMRLSGRWAQARRGGVRRESSTEGPLMQKFRRLNERLEGVFDLREVDCVVYLLPFHHVIVSERASGPLTSAALSSLSKFVLYGFLRPEVPSAREGMQLIAECVSRCIFEETDWESDEVIFMKLLELSTLAFRCDASSLLTVEAACEIYSTCVEIHGQGKASKILRSEAETALRHVTLTAFSRATNLSTQTTPEAPGCFCGAGITLVLVRLMTTLACLMDTQHHPVQVSQSSSRTNIIATGIKSPSLVKFALSLTNVALEAGGPSLGVVAPLVEILRGDVSRHLLRASQSEDLELFSLSLRVVFNLFVSIKDHMKVQLEVFLTSVHLRLLQPDPILMHQKESTVAARLAREELALESLLEFCREPSLMHDLYANYDCDEHCTNLFETIISALCQRAKPVTLPSSGLQFRRASLLNRLALDGVLAVLHAVATRCGSKTEKGGKRAETSTYDAVSASLSTFSSADSLPNSVADVNLSIDLDSAVDNWCSSDPDCLDDAVGKRLAKVKHDHDAIQPSSQIDFAHDDHPRAVTAAKTAEVLRQRRLKKQRLREVADRFNANPLKENWIDLALELELLLPTRAFPVKEQTDSPKLAETESPISRANPISVARFLKNTPGLGKTQVGEFLSRGPADRYPFHADILRAYVGTFDFSGPQQSFVRALRLFLGHFRLPGEAQCIDRLMEAFSRRLFDHQGCGRPFASSDAAFVLSFSTIMLNTDLHNPNLPSSKRMTKEQFVRNNRGINDGNDLPAEYLGLLYDEIRAQQIQVDRELSDFSPAGGGAAASQLTDASAWHRMLHRAADQAPASFTPTVAARTAGAGKVASLAAVQSQALQERDMFSSMAMPIAETLERVLGSAASRLDDDLVGRVLQAIVDYANVCAVLGLGSTLSALVQSLTVRVRKLLTPPLPYGSGVMSKAHFDATDSANDSEDECEDEGCEEYGSEIGNAPIRALSDVDVESLLGSEFESRFFCIGACSHSGDNWRGVRFVLCEALLCTLFILAERQASHLDMDAWAALLSMLLHVRALGRLPPRLARVRFNWPSFDEGKSSPSGVSINSPAAIRCFSMACGAPVGSNSDSNSGGRGGSLLRSLAGLLWGGGADVDGGGNVSSPKSSATTTDGNACAPFVINSTRLASLALAMSTSRTDVLFLGSDILYTTGKNLPSAMAQMEACLGMLRGRLGKLLSSNEEQAKNTSIDGNQDIINDATELETVLLLEWAYVRTFGENSGAAAACDFLSVSVLWQEFSQLLLFVAGEVPTEAAKRCPFLLERVASISLFAASALLTGASESGRTDAQMSQGIATLWTLLKCLSSLPIKTIQGLQALPGETAQSVFLRFSENLTLKNNHWQTLSQLLLVSSSSSIAGRRGSWGALCALVSNATFCKAAVPLCRDLLLLFLRLHFEPEDALSSNEVVTFNRGTGYSTAEQTNPYIAGAMFLEVSVAAAVLAGSTDGTTAGSVKQFPLPASFATVLAAASSTTTSIKTLCVEETLPLSEMSGPCLTVVPVRTSSSEANSIWLDAVRRLSSVWATRNDISLPQSLQRGAALMGVGSLRAMVAIGRISNLPVGSWSAALGSMLALLPLLVSPFDSASFAPIRSSFAKSLRELDMAEPTFLGFDIPCAIASCALLCDVVLEHRTLHRSSPAIVLAWQRLAVALSLNVQAASLMTDVEVGGVDVAVEAADMAGALIRALIPSLPPLNASTSPPPSSMATTNKKGVFWMLGLLPGQSGSSAAQSVLSVASPPRTPMLHSANVAVLGPDALCDCRLLRNLLRLFSAAGPALCRALEHSNPLLMANARRALAALVATEAADVGVQPPSTEAMNNGANPGASQVPLSEEDGGSLPLSAEQTQTTSESLLISEASPTRLPVATRGFSAFVV